MWLLWNHIWLYVYYIEWSLTMICIIICKSFEGDDDSVVYEACRVSIQVYQRFHDGNVYMG